MRHDASAGEFLGRHTTGTQRIRTDARGFEFHLINCVLAVHSLLLGAEGLGFAAALAALATAGDEADCCEEGGAAAGSGVDAYFGGGGEGVEFLANGGLGWAFDVEEEEALRGVAAGWGLGGVWME
jgi:hypothetical protein